MKWFILAVIYLYAIRFLLFSPAVLSGQVEVDCKIPVYQFVNSQVALDEAQRNIRHFVSTQYRHLVYDFIQGSGLYLSTLMAYLDLELIYEKDVVLFGRCLSQASLSVPDKARQIANVLYYKERVSFTGDKEN